MNRIKIIKSKFFICFMLIFTFIVFSINGSAAPVFADKKIDLIKTGSAHEILSFIENGEAKDKSELEWVADPERKSNVLHLPGKGQTLSLDHENLRNHTVTLAGFFKWQGMMSDFDMTEMFDQRYFTFAQNENIWISAKPHAKYDDVDSVYLGFSKGDGVTDHVINSYRSSDAGSNFGIDVDVWHHIAFVMDAQSIKLYVDGNLFLDEAVVLGFEEMRNSSLIIGGGVWGEPTLNALVDDLVLYDHSLSAEQVKRLYDGADPLTDEEYTVITKPLPDEPDAENVPGVVSDSPFSGFSDLPEWIFFLAAYILTGFLVLSVFFSIYKPPSPKKKKKKAKKGGEQ